MVSGVLYLILPDESFALAWLIIFTMVGLGVFVLALVFSDERKRKQNENQIKTENKITFQNLLVCFKTKYPDFEYIYSSVNYLEVKNIYYNQNNKKIGDVLLKMSLDGMRKIYVTLVIIIEGQRFEAFYKRGELNDISTSDGASRLLKSLFDEIEKDPYVARLILSTTY